MSRGMPPLSGQFQAQVAEAMLIAVSGEVARAEAGPASLTRRHLHPARLELLYELAYLRIFVGWEAFLEQVFFRLLCGYQSRFGQALLVPNSSYSRTLQHAEQAVLAGQQYVLWHNPARVIARSQKFFSTCTVDSVLSSNVDMLAHLAAIRHRITHSQTDARRQFDAATMDLSGRRYRGSRAGAFLRDYDRTVAPHIRWLERLGGQLTQLAAQIV